jgi:anti-sigma B factor antagonist
MNMTVRTRRMGDVTVVDIAGRIVLGKESATLRELVSQLTNDGSRKLLFNLAEVSYIDSSGLGNLVSALTNVRRQGGELKLVNLNKNVHDLIQITRLYTVFDVFDGEAEALRSFGQSAAARA